MFTRYKLEKKLLEFLRYWFLKNDATTWFCAPVESCAAIDDQLRQRFGLLLDKLRANGGETAKEIVSWNSCYLLACIIAMDQLPRNFHRDFDGSAYKMDPFVVELLKYGLVRWHKEMYKTSAPTYAQYATVINKMTQLVARQYIKPPAHVRETEAWMAAFLLMPFQHSTNPQDQELGLGLLESLEHTAALNVDAVRVFAEAIRHQKGHQLTLKNFGHFPKRVAVLDQTTNEKMYIAQTPNLPY